MKENGNRLLDKENGNRLLDNKIKFKRLLSTYIDFFISILLLSIIIDILIPDTIQDILLDTDGYISLITFIIFCGLFIFVFSFKDLTFKNKSIGKRICRLAIYDEFGNEIKNKKLLINRNLYSFEYFIFYPFQIIKNNISSADKKYKTIVK